MAQTAALGLGRLFTSPSKKAYDELSWLKTDQKACF